MARLSLSFLGPFQVKLDGIPVTGFVSNKVRALLAYLVVESGRPHSREALCGLLWPDWPQSSALSSLRNALADLRRNLHDAYADPPFLLISRDRIQFNRESDYSLDVDHFQSFLQAVEDGNEFQSKINNQKSAIELYHDPFLEGFSLPDSNPFEEWLGIQRERLQQQVLGAMQRLAAAYECQGEYEQALTCTRLELGIEPWLEEEHRRLMRLLVVSGQRAAALAQYETCRSLLQKELGVEPEAETIRLYEMIRDGGEEIQISQLQALPVPGPCPYKGLQFFEEADAGLFFGREALVERLVERLLVFFADPRSPETHSSPRFLAVVGASGSGKSSVLRAGIVSSVHRRTQWPIILLRPGAHPLESLAAALAEGNGLATGNCANFVRTQSGSEDRGPAANDDKTTIERARRLQDYETTKLQDYITTRLHNYETTSEQVRRLRDDRPSDQLLLVVDQFEEIFTLCQEETERRVFIDNLLAAATEPDGPSVVLIALRADFYAACAPYEALRQTLTRCQEYIGPMSPCELRQAIKEPARLGGWELEPGLADLFLRDIGAAGEGREVEPGALPLLSHALFETWLHRRGRMLTLSGYAEAGGVQGAIARTADAVYARLSPAEQSLARNILLRLTNLGEGAQETRRRVSLAELLPEGDGLAGQSSTTRRVLDTLAGARLVITTTDTAEVAHEALIRQWGRLQDWLNEDREGLRLQRHLTEAAGEWDASRRESGLLYRGARLAQASEWSSAHPGELNPLETVFLRSSQDESEREAAEREAQRQRELETAQRVAQAAEEAAEASQRAAGAERARAEERSLSAQRLRRRALLLVGVTGISLLLALAAILLFHQSAHNARLASARELAAASINNLGTDQQRSLLMAIQAVELADLPETESALHQAFGSARLRDSFLDPGLDPNYSEAAFAPDGSRFATMERYGRINIWGVDAVSMKVQREPLRTLSMTERGNALAFSPDGRFLAVAGEGISLKIWDSSGEKLLHSLSSLYGAITSIAFSPDGKLMATATEDRVVVWDPSTGQELQTLFHPTGIFYANTVMFTLNGNRLAILGQGSTKSILSIWERIPGTPVNGKDPLFFYLVDIQDAEFFGSISISPDGAQLATAGCDIKLYDLTPISDASPPILTKQFNSQDYTCGPVLFFTPDGRRLVSGRWSPNVKVWDAASGSLLYTLTGNAGILIEMALSRDGTRLLTIDKGALVKIWDLSPTGVQEWFALPEMQFGSRLSPDGRRLIAVTPGLNPKIGIWDMTVSPPRLEKTLDTGPHCCLIDTDQEFTRLVTFERPGSKQTARIWDLQTGQIKDVFPLSDEGLIQDLDLSPDGMVMATWQGKDTCGNGPTTVIFWDLPAHKQKFTRLSECVTDGAFSPDGMRIATCSRYDGTVHIRDASSGEELLHLDGHTGYVAALSFSPDGKRLLTGSEDRTAKVWDTQTGKELLTLAGESSMVLNVAFSSDSRLLATGTVDRIAKVWDAATGQELLSLPGIMVKFTPDGKRLITDDISFTHFSGDTRGYYLDIQDLLPLARSRLVRSWTQEECRQFLHTNTCPPSP